MIVWYYQIIWKVFQIIQQLKPGINYDIPIWCNDMASTISKEAKVYFYLDLS